MSLLKERFEEEDSGLKMERNFLVLHLFLLCKMRLDKCWCRSNSLDELALRDRSRTAKSSSQSGLVLDCQSSQ